MYVKENNIIRHGKFKQNIKNITFFFIYNPVNTYSITKFSLILTE